MNYQNVPTDKENEEYREAKAELLAELLTLMDEKQGGPGGTTGLAAQTKPLNLIELFYFFLSKLHYVVLGMVLGAVLMGYYASVSVTPYFSATSKLFIIGTTGNGIMSDLQLGAALTNDYQEVFRTWEVHQMVNEALGTNYSYSALQRMVSISNPKDTRVLYITARHTDSQLAADIANAYATAAKRFIVQTMQTDEPSTFSIALIPSVASSVSITSYVIRGALIGTALVLGILLLVFLLDTRPRSPEDVMRYAQIPTLAVIPINPDMLGKKQKRRRHRT